MKNIPLILLFTFIHYQITTFSEKKNFSKIFKWFSRQFVKLELNYILPSF